MRLRSFVIGFAAVVWASTLALALPVDSNIAFGSYAQTRGVSKLQHCSIHTATLCNTDADCGFGDTCSPHHCSTTTATLCNRDADCPSGETCQGVTACTTLGGEGCGGCYAESLTSINGGDPIAQLTLVNPEWQPIGPMIESALDPRHDPLPPPQSAPVQIHGTVALTKINIGGDFPGSHVGDDQNTFIKVDSADAGLLATGNHGPPSCPGEGCDLVEMEREFKKYPLFAWAGEGDGITAVGRWIFDCGHPDPNPRGGCSNNASRPCILDSDCATPGTCTNPAPTSNLRAELHPPHALAVFRNKSNGKTPATRADVYVSTDTGGAGDTCTVTHLTGALDVLYKKDCFANHCSVNTNRSCTVDKDCAPPQKCIVYDPNQGGPLMDVNASDFVFDMPLPPLPSGATSATLMIKTKDFKPTGGSSPKAIFTPLNGSVGTVATTTLNVVVPMSVAFKSGKKPNVFAQRITAYWKGDKTPRTHVQVAFQSLTIHNPLKAAAPVFDRVCTRRPSDPKDGLTSTTCATTANCPAGLCMNNPSLFCHADSECPKNDSCVDPQVCVGGVTPGWEMFGEVNGDWIQFAGLTKVGTEGVFPAAPYIKPSDGQTISLKKPALKFDEYVPDNGTIHIASTGHGMGCNDAYLYGHNLKESVHRYGTGVGASCLGEADPNPGRLEVTHPGPSFSAAPANALCTAAGTPAVCCTGDGTGTCADANAFCTDAETPYACCDANGTGSCSDNTLCTGVAAPLPCCTGSGTGECSTVTCIPPAKSGKPALCTATSGTGDGGSCSIATTQLCLLDKDCAGTCSTTGGSCATSGDCKHCSGDASQFCAATTDCTTPQTCVSGSETCDAYKGTCNGACSDTERSCHVDADCDAPAKCEFGHAFDLTYTIKVL